MGDIPSKRALAQFAGREREVAAFFDLLEKGRHETAAFSDEEAAAKRIERFVMDDREFFCKRHRAEFPTNYLAPDQSAEESLVSQTFISWNQVGDFLRQLQALRSAA